MKTKLKNCGLRIADWGKRKGGKCALLALAGLALVAGIVKAGDFAAATINVPTALTSVTNATLQATTGTAFQPDSNTGITLFFGGSALQSSNVEKFIGGFDISPDLTNWTTSTPFKITNTANGTTLVGNSVTLTADQLRGIKGIRFGSVQGVNMATAVSNFTASAGWVRNQ